MLEVHDRPLGVPIPTEGDLSPAKCVILVPHQGRIVSKCQMALIELERRGYVVWRVEGYAAIDQARNEMGSAALREGFAETFWIDSDIAFHPDDVDRLRELGMPVTCGIYPKKGQRELAIHVLPGTERFRFGVHGKLEELMYAGTGFLHVRRSVYQQMIEQLSLPHCNEHFHRSLWPFFQPLVRPWKGHSWYLAEDYAFCHRVRQCGIPIVADTRIRLWHVGDYGYGWEDAGIDRERFGDFEFRLE